MCGRYTLRVKLNLLLSQFTAELAEGTEWEPRLQHPAYVERAGGAPS
jgi:hypothetical protein